MQSEFEFDIERLKEAVRSKVDIGSPYSIVGSRARAVVFASKSLAVYLGMERLKALRVANLAAEIAEKGGELTEAEAVIAREGRLVTKAMTAGRVYLFAADSQGGGVFIPLRGETACHLMAIGRLPQAAKEALKEAGLTLSVGPVGLIEAYVFSRELSEEALERMAKRYRDMGNEDAAYDAILMRLSWQMAATKAALRPPAR